MTVVYSGLDSVPLLEKATPLQLGGGLSMRMNANLSFYANAAARSRSRMTCSPPPTICSSNEANGNRPHTLRRRISPLVAELALGHPR